MSTDLTEVVFENCDLYRSEFAKAIANKADADRDTVDSYLEELETIHERQCEMLSMLHERILEYRGSRGPTVERMGDVLSDDDSFEDLRD